MHLHPEMSIMFYKSHFLMDCSLYCGAIASLFVVVVVVGPPLLAIVPRRATSAL